MVFSDGAGTSVAACSDCLAVVESARGRHGHHRCFRCRRGCHVRRTGHVSGRCGSRRLGNSQERESSEGKLPQTALHLQRLSKPLVRPGGARKGKKKLMPHHTHTHRRPAGAGRGEVRRRGVLWPLLSLLVHVPASPSSIHRWSLTLHKHEHKHTHMYGTQHEIWRYVKAVSATERMRAAGGFAATPRRGSLGWPLRARQQRSHALQSSLVGCRQPAWYWPALAQTHRHAHRHRRADIHTETFTHSHKLQF